MTKRALQVYEDFLGELEQISQETERVARQWLNADSLGFEEEKRFLEDEAKNLLQDLASIRERMEEFLSHAQSIASAKGGKERNSQ